MTKLSELSEADLQDIVGLVNMGYTRKEVAAAYRISPATVSAIVLRRGYQELRAKELASTSASTNG